MKKIKTVYVITPVRITYTERLSPGEYEEEIKGVMEEIEGGAREWAYSTLLKPGKSKVVSEVADYKN